MTTAIAILALLISLASLGFSVYQYRVLHRVRVGEKATTLLRLAQDLRRKTQDLQNTIDSTDHIDDHADFLERINAMIEVEVQRVAASNAHSFETLIKIEQVLLPVELEIDLLHKQVKELGRFNAEVREYEESKAKRREA
jgi:hypothetical protein